MKMIEVVSGAEYVLFYVKKSKAKVINVFFEPPS